MKESDSHVGSAASMAPAGQAEPAAEVSVPVAVQREEVPSPAAELVISLLPGDLRLRPRPRMRELRRPRWRRPRM